MDYSKYYLKNYLKNKEAIERDYERQANFQDDVSQQDYQVDDTVEIEVTPQLIGMVQTNYQIDDEDSSPIIDIIPQSYDRYGARRKGWIMTLAIITCVLLTVVVGDFATGGALLAGLSKQGEAMPTQSFYAVALKICDTYSVARMYAEQQRLQGGAGYILKAGDSYALVGVIYADH